MFNYLGSTSGHLTDRVTQRWVQITGRTVDLQEAPWLVGPVGKPQSIGKQFFHELARENGWQIVSDGASRGLLEDFRCLTGPDFDPALVHPEIVSFYQRTSEYTLDAWSEWCGAFRPFGWLLAITFSRRLQQLNLPLRPLDTSRGLTSEVLSLSDPRSGRLQFAAWVRRFVGSGDVIYAGAYTTCDVPGRLGSCVKVVFPLPNGNAIVIMRPVAHPDGSFSIISAGDRFGDPGFYFTVHSAAGTIRARYLKALQETIHVYPEDSGIVRANHTLRLWGATFLRLHYKLIRRQRYPGVQTAP